MERSTAAFSHMPEKVDVSVSSVDSTWNLAQIIANSCKVGDVILLTGAVGAGKTTFARGFIRSFVGDPDLTVASPSYLLHLQVL